MFMSLQVDLLWTNKPTELLVAIMEDTEEKNEYLLHHKTFQTLKPHNWVFGEVSSL